MGQPRQFKSFDASFVTIGERPDMTANILMVEDKADLVTTLRDRLRKQEYMVSIAERRRLRT